MDEPIAGVRSMAARMLPASLRAGIMTLTDRSRGAVSAGLSRATMMMVRQNHGRNGAIQRLIRFPIPKSSWGMRIRVSLRITSQPLRSRRLRRSCRESQLRAGRFGFKPRRPAKPRIGRQRVL